MTEPYLHCQCGHSIYAHLPTGKCDMPDCVCGGFDRSMRLPRGEEPVSRYRQVEDADVFACLDCPVGSRYLVIAATDAHDRWHDQRVLQIGGTEE